jgi:hypothetical protein
MTSPPTGPPPYGYPYQPPPPPPQPRISVGMVFAGVGIYFVINSVIGFAALIVGGSATNGVNMVFVGTAILLALIAFGGGGGLLAVRSPYAKGLGLGLMIGWALTSVFTVGICTGLNPAVYSTL